MAARAQPDFHSSLMLSMDYLSYNFAKPPFNNRNLRLAATYAIDRDRINNRLLHGARKTIYSVVPQGIPGYDAEGKRFTPHYDPARARMHLVRAKKEMGPNFPSMLTLKYVSGSDLLRKEVPELQYEWMQIGLNVKKRSSPPALLTILIVAFAFFGDGLRDAFDPQARES